MLKPVSEAAADADEPVGADNGGAAEALSASTT